MARVSQPAEKTLSWSHKCQGTTSQVAEKLDFRTALKGHGFIRAEQALSFLFFSRASAREKPAFRSFSATCSVVPKMPHFDRGFSPIGLWLIAIRPSFSVFPQPVKPVHCFPQNSTRLQPLEERRPISLSSRTRKRGPPDKTRLSLISNRSSIIPGKAEVPCATCKPRWRLR